MHVQYDRSITVDRMLLDSSHLTLLAALTRNETLAAASADIHLSPSAASRRLREAERRVGYRLAEVDGRSMSLTTAGRILAEAAVTTADQLAEAELAARWLGSNVTRNVRIGVEFYDSISWLLPTIENHSFEIVRVPTGESERALERRQADLVVTVQSTRTKHSALIADDLLTLVVSPSHELAERPQVSADDVAANRYLAGALDPQPGFEYDSFFRPASTAPTNITTISSLGCLLDLVSSGQGITIQPSRVVAPLRADLCCVPLDRNLPVSWSARMGPSPSEQTAALLAHWTEGLAAGLGRW